MSPQPPQLQQPRRRALRAVLWGGLVGLVGLLPVAALAREPELPRRNLLVELRWVETRLSGAALAGVREGAVVVGTAGSVSPGPSQSLSTRSPEVAPPQRLIVLNGYSASVMTREAPALQWLAGGLELPLGEGGRATPRLQLQPRQSPASAEPSEGFVVSPRWPGGEAPVRVELRSLAPMDGGRAEVLSTVQLRLDEWLTVARSGAAPHAAPGQSRSSDAQAQRGRELQLRISLAP